ncbi:protein CDV3 homolog [Uranotaenia lowii]|uniref:protein CDV3 homolog n=1 Tax=Uranotaenia lowii TaxID=190385 RepID=UPI00247A8D30|nr:protein CDV3 homolog [Uranotaenia lowii]
MADLDDFFAKKDRKKGKTVKKFTTAEELAKKIEDTAKKADAKRKPTILGGAGADGTAAATAASAAGGDGTGAVDPPVASKPVEPVVEEEWKEFEEERKDYSGLKLAQLNILNQDSRENASGEDGNEMGGGNDGESGGGSGDKTGAGAWKKLDSSASGDRQQHEQQQQPRPGSSIHMGLGLGLRNRPTKKTAPDLKNEEFFPTLGTEVPDPKIKKDTTFEEVKHGGRVRQSDLPSAAPLSVGNRFTSLSNDAS